MVLVVNESRVRNKNPRISGHVQNCTSIFPEHSTAAPAGGIKVTFQWRKKKRIIAVFIFFDPKLLHWNKIEMLPSRRLQYVVQEVQMYYVANFGSGWVENTPNLF